MMLYIQDPTYENSKLVLDAILEGCSEATNGAGAYAFASADGVRLLMEDPVFLDFIAQGHFYLIVGMDEITNTRTLSALNEFSEQYPHLKVHAFLHDTTRSTFHPKFCWFNCGEYGYVVTGSGNLTQKGMQQNREAFDITKVSKEELQNIQSLWDSWVHSASTYIKSIDAADVTERAKENSRRASVLPSRRNRRATTNESSERQAENQPPTATLVLHESEENDEPGSWEFEPSSKVLIAEIPSGSNRWKQANFDAKTFETYFESARGVTGQKALILRDVRQDGSLGKIRHRPPVSVKSKNYRVELSVERGVHYPKKGRPLGVFVKLSSRTFLYMVVFPSNSEHTALQQLIDVNRTAKQAHIGQLVRYQTNAQELQRISPSLPLLQYLSQAIDL